MSYKPSASPTPQEDTSKYPLIRGEIALWSAVILQALLDSQLKSNKGDAQKWKREALHFLTSNSPWFQNVCDMAFKDPHYTYIQIQQVLSRLDTGDLP